MFIEGKLSNTFSIDQLKSIISDKKRSLFNRNEIPLPEIIELLVQLGKKWEKNGVYYNKALDKLSTEKVFSAEMLKQTLDIIPFLLNKENIEQRLFCEIGNSLGLDEPIIDHCGSRVLYVPVGLVLHVTAGNVFISFIDSLLMSLLTKNVSFIKVSSSNKTFPELFFESFLEVDVEMKLLKDITCLSWKGGSSDIEILFKKEMDLIIAWGSQEMVESYRKDLPIDTKLIDYGPKISFGVVDKKSLEDQSVIDGICKDVCQWDQAACSNMQNLFVTKDVNLSELMTKLKVSFDNFSLRRAELSGDEHVEILKEISAASYLEFSDDIGFVKGTDYLIRFDDSRGLSPTALNRTLRIKLIDSIESLALELQPFKFYLQTCGILLSSSMDKAMRVLSHAGVKRFTKPGSMLGVVNGASHDGHYPMKNFIQSISVEFSASLQEFKSYKGLSDSKVYFATGGTTGLPKFSLFSNSEFDHMAFLLSESYKDKILRNETVANLFVAGNMWSSFILVYKALEKMNVSQLPIGGNSSDEDIFRYLREFNPESVFGIPSMIYSLACNIEGENIPKIKRVFYAGEGINKKYKEKISSVFGVEEFYSAGYATVDAGMIAYQDKTCSDGEHILFNGVSMEVRDEEAFVSSTLRSLDPVISFSTGDKVEMLGDRRFKLLGRKDPLIMIWGTRITIKQIKRALSLINYEDSFQVVTKFSASGTEILQIMTQKEVETTGFIEKIINESADLRQTLKDVKFDDRIAVTFDKFITKKRTGKTPIFIDLRI
jgi:phenylacetate-coenzyme A ligase PaaK-like adenylate-forming protein